MENILYEYRFDIPLFLLYMIPVLIGAGLIVAGAILCRNGKRRVIGVIMFIISFLLFIPVPEIAYMINDHIIISDAIKNGTYSMVSGYVSDLNETEKDGTPVMRFKISDVRFEYEDNGQVSGYHKLKSKGGVISGDGQYLTVRYMQISRPYRIPDLFDNRKENYIAIIYISELQE